MSEECDQVSDEHVFQELLKKKPRLVVLIYASWCPFCKKFVPVFKQHADRKPQHFLMLQDDQEIAATKYSVNIYPSVLFFENGTLAGRLDGLPGSGLQEEQLVNFIKLCHIPTGQDHG